MERVVFNSLYDWVGPFEYGIRGGSEEEDEPDGGDLPVVRQPRRFGPRRTDTELLEERGHYTPEWQSTGSGEGWGGNSPGEARDDQEALEVRDHTRGGQPLHWYPW